MEEFLIQNAVAHASRHDCQLAERLGFGIHGMIFVAEDKSGGGKTAVKSHRDEEPYRRELNIAFVGRVMRILAIRAHPDFLQGSFLINTRIYPGVRRR